MGPFSEEIADAQRRDLQSRLAIPSDSFVTSGSSYGAQIEQGKARAFLAVENLTYGIDRIVTILPDGRGFAWTKINRCGKVVFDGKTAPKDCPKPVERD